MTSERFASYPHTDAPAFEQPAEPTNAELEALALVDHDALIEDPPTTSTPMKPRWRVVVTAAATVALIAGGAAVAWSSAQTPLVEWPNDPAVAAAEHSYLARSAPFDADIPISCADADWDDPVVIAVDWNDNDFFGDPGEGDGSPKGPFCLTIGHGTVDRSKVNEAH